MTKIVLSHEDYERVLQEGLDLEAYLQGRFDEAGAEVTYINEGSPLEATIEVLRERLDQREAIAADIQVGLTQPAKIADVEAIKSHVLYAQATADRALNNVAELTARVEELERLDQRSHIPTPDTFLGDSGRLYKVRDSYYDPGEEDVAIILGFDPVENFPIRVFWQESKRTERMCDEEFNMAYRI